MPENQIDEPEGSQSSSPTSIILTDSEMAGTVSDKLPNPVEFETSNVNLSFPVQEFEQ